MAMRWVCFAHRQSLITGFNRVSRKVVKRIISSVNFFRSLVLLGTTYVECKTGYGLEWPAELRLLKLLEQARSYVPIGISITYCAAHAVPK